MRILRKKASGRNRVNVVRHGQSEDGSLWLGSAVPSTAEDFGITRELNQTGLYVHADDSYTVWFYYEENGTGAWEQYTQIDVTDEDYNMGINIPWEDASSTKLVTAMYFQSAEEIKIRVMPQEGPIMVDGTPGDDDLTANVLFSLAGPEEAEVGGLDGDGGTEVIGNDPDLLNDPNFDDTIDLKSLTIDGTPYKIPEGGSTTVINNVVGEILDVNGDNIYYVSTDGDNSTGEGGNPSKPFSTIAMAKKALLADLSAKGETDGKGTLIWVHPGSYMASQIQWQNGNIYLSPGTTLHTPRFTKAQGSTFAENFHKSPAELNGVAIDPDTRTCTITVVNSSGENQDITTNSGWFTVGSTLTFGSHAALGGKLYTVESSSFDPDTGLNTCVLEAGEDFGGLTAAQMTNVEIGNGGDRKSFATLITLKQESEWATDPNAYGYYPGPATNFNVWGKGTIISEGVIAQTPGGLWATGVTSVGYGCSLQFEAATVKATSAIGFSSYGKAIINLTKYIWEGDPDSGYPISSRNKGEQTINCTEIDVTGKCSRVLDVKHQAKITLNADVVNFNPTGSSTFALAQAVSMDPATFDFGELNINIKQYKGDDFTGTFFSAVQVGGIKIKLEGNFNIGGNLINLGGHGAYGGVGSFELLISGSVKTKSGYILNSSTNISDNSKITLDAYLESEKGTKGGLIRVGSGTVFLGRSLYNTYEYEEETFSGTIEINGADYTQLNAPRGVVSGNTVKLYNLDSDEKAHFQVGGALLPKQTRAKGGNGYVPLAYNDPYTIITNVEDIAGVDGEEAHLLVTCEGNIDTVHYNFDTLISADPFSYETYSEAQANGTDTKTLRLKKPIGADEYPGLKVTNSGAIVIVDNYKIVTSDNQKSIVAPSGGTISVNGTLISNNGDDGNVTYDVLSLQTNPSVK